MFHMTKTQENVCRDTCIFIISVYIEKLFRSHVAIEAPYQDILFIQCLIKYENINKKISNVALKHFGGHLWYITSEEAAFSFFDSNIPLPIKIKIVDSLKIQDKNENIIKRYVTPMYNLTLPKNSQISDFINSSSMKFFERFNIATDFFNQIQQNST